MPGEDMNVTRHDRRPIRAALLALGAALVLLMGFGADVSKAADTPDEPHSLLGSYLAGRFAQDLRDTDAASGFYGFALDRDGGNELILQQAFLTEAQAGNWERAAQLANAAAGVENNNKLARFFLGLQALKGGNLAAADDQFRQATAGPIGELTANLARAWVKAARGDPKGAKADLDATLQADWEKFYKVFHGAVLSDLAGDRATAEAAYQELIKSDPRNLNVALAYAGHASVSGDQELAKSILIRYLAGSSTGHPTAIAALSKLRKGGTLPLLITDPVDGIAEVFYGLGEALTSEGGVDIGTVYIQYSLYLRPNAPLALAGLASVYENTRQYDRAIAAYTKLAPDTPIYINAAIRQSLNLSALERDDEAKALLVKLLAIKATDAEEPADDPALAKAITGLQGLSAGSRGDRVKDLQRVLAMIGYDPGTQDGAYGSATADAVRKFQEANGLPANGNLGAQTRKMLAQRLVGVGRPPGVKAGSVRQVQIQTALGNLERGRKNFEEAARYYTSAIEQIEHPAREHWSQFYSRGVCYERLKQWPKAEADFRKAIALDGEEPLVLNYLGYTWVDRGERIDEALGLINKAVKLKPDDGYFVDSLGWAYYKMGRYEDAAASLERAVELKADDPVINDHLGDAYWRAGRRLEAKFQWSAALTLKPEPEDVAKIQAKLKNGLPELASGATGSKQRQADNNAQDAAQPVQ